MKQWHRVALILCIFGFLKDFRPSEPFMIEFVTSPEHNLTVEQVEHDVLPIGTYSYVPQLVVAFLITDYFRYKPMIIVSGLAGTIVWSLFVWSRSLRALQVLQVFYAMFLATDIGFNSYIYTRVDRKHYQKITSYFNSATLAGRFLASISSQMLIYFGITDYLGLNYISLGAQLSITVWSFLLPPVPASIYFHQEQPPEEQIELKSDKRQSTPESTCHRASTLLWSHFKSAYTNFTVIRYSLWNAVAMCMMLQISVSQTFPYRDVKLAQSVPFHMLFIQLGGRDPPVWEPMLQMIVYMQPLWSTIGGADIVFWNGSMDAGLTLISSLASLLAGFVPQKYLKMHITLTGLSLIAIVEGLALFLATVTSNLTVSYVCYILIGILHAFSGTLVTSEIAKHICDNSFALIFGINSTLALILHFLFTLVDSNGWFALDIRGQFTVGSYVYIAIGVVYGIFLVDELCRRRKPKQVNGSVDEQQLNSDLNSDTASNYVDRVRIRDSSSSFGGPGRGSGWRQKSLSNIDLPTSYRGIAGGVAGTGGLVGAGQFRYRDYDSGLYDLYSRIDSRREEYDDLYGVNPKASRAASSASSKQRQQQKQQQRDQERDQQAQDQDQQQQQRQKHHHHHHHRHQEFYNVDGNDACSLRRTRSLAVIREETYNDLHLHGRGARRSQLIPRAKLVDRNFFKDRYNFIYDDGEGLDPAENDTHYTLARRFSAAQGQPPFPWHTDKSDLDSIDSSIFKHSLHQQSSFEGSRHNSIRSGDSSKFVSKVEVHSEYSGASKSETGIEADLKHLDDLSLREDAPPRPPSKTSTLETIKNHYHRDGKFTVKEEEESGITIIEIKDSQVSAKSSSVISYDSIYLSSESDDKEILDELLPNVHLTEDNDLIDIKIEDYDDLFKETDLEKAESTIDTLYGQVTKPKPKIVAVEPKIQPNDSLKRYIKNTSRGTIERLSIISNLKLRQEFATKEKSLVDSDYQYNSLPDAADVCKILRNSERIDAKLRRICDNDQSGRSTRTDSDHYDSLPRLDKSSLNLTQTPSDEDGSLEESDKGAPSIEVVETPTREVLSHASSKVYLKDFGLELDYENSVVTNSDQDSDITIVAPQQTPTNVPSITVTPAIVVTPAEKASTKKTEPVIYSTFASTVGKQTTNRINFESKEKPKPHPEAIADIKTKLKPIPVVEVPNIPVALAPTVKLGGKKVIVDEVAAKAAKREKELEKCVKRKEPTDPLASKPIPKKNSEPPIKKEESKPEPIPIVNSRPPDPKPPEPKEGSPKVDHSSLFKDTNPFKEQARREVKNRVVDRPLFKGVRRFNSTENIYTSAPIIVTKTFNNFIKTNEVKTKSFDSLIVESSNERKLDQKKMPRPQVIQIVDSKPQGQKQDAGTLRKGVQDGQRVQKEFLHKVDSVRSYWSKMMDEADAREDQDAEDLVDSGNLPPKNEQVVQPAKSDEKTGSSSSMEQQKPLQQLQQQQQQQQQQQMPKKSASRQNSSRNKYSTYQIDEGTELQSFSPTVEIIELDGQKQAALVKPKNSHNLDFDHVRYKVMKSEMFQKNLLVNHRKAAQFDGLMQYLQDYSFQELLAHNNVVIIEPVRTKIEKISDKPPQASPTTCRITTGALSNHGGGENVKRVSGLKKHFFYHPIRVNKELLDEELPSPDTVRNVRKLFEGTLRLGTAAKQAYEDAKTSGVAHAGIRKWDSASLSSGVSSGDLSSPCECGENEMEADSGDENMIGDDELESHYVSQDVLEKIRECGSTVTYYGGQVVDKKSEHMNTMTKAIMKEIRGLERKTCQVCQPHGCRQLIEQRQSAKLDGLGVKFKLVKSNSCSSRLELAGTGKTPPDLMKNHRNNSSSSSSINSGRPKLPKPYSVSATDSNNNNNNSPNDLPDLRDLPTVEEPEESVRDLVSRLESNNTLNARNKPRIIESKCIEKMDEVKTEPAITINSQTIEVPPAASKTSQQQPPPPVEEPAPVTVNNHITVPNQLIIPALLKDQKPSKTQNHQSSSADRPKVCRNKNVDLAFQATITKASNKPAKEKENLARKSSLVTSSSLDTIDSLESIMSPSNAPAPKMVTFKDDKNSNNGKGGEIEEQENLKPSVLAEQRKLDELTSPKLVNWSSLGKFDERQYFANDKKLIEKRKYDEMEFEEFEVLDPNAVIQHHKEQQEQQQQQQQSECYDSLNSGK